jgi:hypothetical protein
VHRILSKPPVASASFCVPAPANANLPVINAPPVDQTPTPENIGIQDFPRNSIMLSGDAKFAQAEYARNPTFEQLFPNSAANCENEINPLVGNAIILLILFYPKHFPIIYLVLFKELTKKAGKPFF